MMALLGNHRQFYEDLVLSEIRTRDLSPKKCNSQQYKKKLGMVSITNKYSKNVTSYFKTDQKQQTNHNI
jgi:hypothetical protein